MHLTRIEVRDFRNLASISLHPIPGLNIVEGENASGKTSFLEALHMLGLARSFRTPKSELMIRQDSQSLTLFAEVHNGTHHRVGLQRFLDHRMDTRLDGNRVESRAQLAAILPVQLITPESISLLIGAPTERRHYLDWLMFHVEHSFHDHWSDYQRVLKQRNALLRMGQFETLQYWSDMLIQHGIIIDDLRKSVIERLIPYICEYTHLLLPDMDFQCSYRQGWKKDSSLNDAIDESLETDQKMKYTTVGPHRADLVVRSGNDKVVDVFSRGQLKLLLCAMKLGQMALFKHETGNSPVVLIDDLPAELDTGHRKLLLSLLHQLESQVFVTTTDRKLLDYSGWNDVKLFHVEHGQMKEVV